MKILSLLVVAGVIILHAITGFYNFSSITTQEISKNYSTFVNKSLRLKQIRILEYKTHKMKEGVTLELNVYNGYTIFFDPKPPKTAQLLKQSIKVYARVQGKSQFFREITGGRERIPEIQIKVLPKFIILEKYNISIIESWLLLPYQFSLSIFNAFFPLNVSVPIAMVIQTAIIVIIIILVLEGAIYVLPKFD